MKNYFLYLVKIFLIQNIYNLYLYKKSFNRNLYKSLYKSIEKYLIFYYFHIQKNNIIFYLFLYIINYMKF